MKFFQNLSIRSKLIVTMVAVTTIALGFGFTLVIIADITLSTYLRLHPYLLSSVSILCLLSPSSVFCL